VPGAFCNARGRVVADLRLLLPAPGLGLLRVSAALAALVRRIVAHKRGTA
jgi:hypothetical protein